MGCLFAILWHVGAIPELVADAWHAWRSRNDPPPTRPDFPLSECCDRHACGMCDDCLYNCWDWE
jgi:hypothetical protein